MQIQVVVQGLTFAVPLVSFLVDWPVGTVFIAVAFPSFEHMVEAHPVLVGSYFSRRLCIVNPPDGMLPLNLTIDPMLPVLMLVGAGIEATVHPQGWERLCNLGPLDLR